MALLRTTPRRSPRNTHAAHPAKHSIKARILGPKTTNRRTAAGTTTTTTTTTRTTKTTTGRTAAHHHKHHATLGDKVSGALLKLKGSLTRRPGVKAAGTRRMHGTDGRGSRRVY